ncbi:MAG: radical SAM protein [Desulfovibrionaceae bacterium]|nr:radical SAM protein [Desulfovibrionaceae bacterium]
MAENDPLKDAALKGPGLVESLRRGFLGQRRPLDCIQLEVSSVCAGRCIYCPHTTRAETWRSRHMEAKVFAALWPLIRASERVHLQGWGEPLLHPRFFEFVSLARRADCQVSSTTCGLKMDADIARRLARCGMDLLAFSLVGTDAASNDSGRVGVPFERVCSAIRMVRAAVRNEGYSALDVHLAYLLLADRVEAVAGLPRLMEELDVSTAVVSTLDYIADDVQTPLAFAPHEGQKTDLARRVLREAAREAAGSGRSIVYALPGTQAVAHAGGCRENGHFPLRLS